MQENDLFSLQDFMPYMLNQAAEATGLTFQKYYKDKYGILRTEWRVLYHLGRYGELTAKEICKRANSHKTKVSRAVSALETRRFLLRETLPSDRRHELLSLTKSGRAAFEDLVQLAAQYNAHVLAPFSAEEQAIVRRFLLHVGKM